MAYVIESGIPLPVASNSRTSGTTAVLRAMKVGDSVLLPFPKTPSLYYSLAKNLRIKIAVRKVGAEQVRLWRLE